MNDVDLNATANEYMSLSSPQKAATVLMINGTAYFKDSLKTEKIVLRGKLKINPRLVFLLSLIFLIITMCSHLLLILIDIPLIYYFSLQSHSVNLLKVLNLLFSQISLVSLIKFQIVNKMYKQKAGEMFFIFQGMETLKGENNYKGENI